jgi:nucleotide-binding universal stress UspA family protein
MDVIVEFNPPLNSLAAGGSPEGAELRTRLWDRLVRWQRDLGLPGTPRLVCRPADPRRGPGFLDFAVLAGGHRCPYDRGLILREHGTAAGRDALDGADPIARVRDWVRAGLTATSSEPASGDKDAALRFLTSVIFETIAASPDRLVDRESAVGFLHLLQEANADLGERLAAVSLELVESVLREVARVPVALRDREAAARWLVRGSEAGWSVTQVAERMFDVLRPGVIDIHLHPAALGRMLGEHPDPAPGARFTADRLQPEIGETLGLMCDGLFYELGLYLLHVCCVADAELPETGFRFRLNDQLTGVRIGLAEHEILVNDTAQRLSLLKVAGKPHTNPASGHECAVIAAGDRGQVEKAGLTTWSPFDYAILSLAGEVRRQAARLLSVDDVDFAMARLHEVLPRLVEATRSEMSSILLTRILRHLLRERIGIRDLRSILHLLLEFRFTTGFRAPTAGWNGLEPYVYIGDLGLHEEPYFTESDPYRARFDLSRLQLGVDPPPAWLESGRVHAEFVKCGLRRALTHQISAGQGTLICYVVDPQLEGELRETLARGADPGGLVEARADEVLSAIAGRTQGRFDSTAPVVFIAGTPDVAFLFEDLIAGDFPELRVVHRQVLDPSANVQPIDRIPGLEPIGR